MHCKSNDWFPHEMQHCFITIRWTLIILVECSGKTTKRIFREMLEQEHIIKTIAKASNSMTDFKQISTNFNFKQIVKLSFCRLCTCFGLRCFSNEVTSVTSSKHYLLKVKDRHTTRKMFNINLKSLELHNHVISVSLLLTLRIFQIIF